MDILRCLQVDVRNRNVSAGSGLHSYCISVNYSKSFFKKCFFRNLQYVCNIKCLCFLVKIFDQLLEKMKCSPPHIKVFISTCDVIWWWSGIFILESAGETGVWQHCVDFLSLWRIPMLFEIFWIAVVLRQTFILSQGKLVYTMDRKGL